MVPAIRTATRRPDDEFHEAEAATPRLSRSWWAARVPSVVPDRRIPSMITSLTEVVEISGRLADQRPDRDRFLRLTASGLSEDELAAAEASVGRLPPNARSVFSAVDLGGKALHWLQFPGSISHGMATHLERGAEYDEDERRVSPLCFLMDLEVIGFDRTRTGTDRDEIIWIDNSNGRLALRGVAPDFERLLCAAASLAQAEAQTGSTEVLHAVLPRLSGIGFSDAHVTNFEMACSGVGIH